MSLQFPNVPLLPGVPVVARAVNAILTTPQILLNADAVGNLLSLFQPQWGIFDDEGSPLILGDSVISVGAGLEFKVADYPIEDGDFRSYNKVALPYDAKITFAVARSVANRAQFLVTVDALVESLQLVNITTPEATYLNANLVKRGYERVRNNGGRSMIYVDVFMREIRVAATSTFTNTADPSAQDPTATGTNQPTDESPPANPDIPVTDTPQPSPTTTPQPQTEQSGVIGGQGANSTSNGTVGTSQTTVVGNTDTGTTTSTPMTAPDGTTTTQVTMTGIAANDPILQRTDGPGEGATAYRQPDGTYTLIYSQPTSPPGTNNQTIADSSPNKGVAN